VARVFVTRALPGDALDRLRAAHEVEVWPGPLPPPADVLRAEAAASDGLLALLTDRVDAALLAGAAPRLRVVANYAVGSDNVDLAAAAAHGVAVGVTPDVLTDATADLTLALLLAAARDLPAAAAAVRDGAWRTWEPRGWLGLELRGARLLVVGPGRIGRAVAERARAFGMDVALAGRDDPLAGLEDADVVSLHAPLTPGTHHLVDAAALGRMRHGALLVNTARGPLVDTDALVEALRAGRVRAALDVTDPEPLPPAHPLATAPGALVVPHIGSATHAARARMTALAVENLEAGLSGRPLPHSAT
jgi:glyoxylate reductase